MKVSADYQSITQASQPYSTQFKRILVQAAGYKHVCSDVVGNDWIRDLPYFHELVLKEKSIERVLFDAYFSKQHLERARLASHLLGDDKTLIILGDPGCGKTTLLNYLFRYGGEMKEFRKEHEFVIVTCNEDYGPADKDGRSLQLHEFVLAEVTRQLHSIAVQKCSFAVESLYRDDTDYRHLVKAIRDAMTRMRGSGEELDEVKRGRVLLGLMQGPTFTRRLLDWFGKYHSAKRIAVVLDNLDCFTDQQREACFANVLPMLRRRNVKLIIPLRYGTELGHRDALHQYGGYPKKVATDVPLFKDVLELRLTRVPTGVKLGGRRDKARQMDTWWQIWKHFSEGDAITVLNGLFGTDTRRKLEVFNEALISYDSAQYDFKQITEIETGSCGC